MSFDIAGGLRNLLPGPLDSLRGPYDSLAAANGAVPSTVVNGKNFREGKFVEIGTNGTFKTYWWKGTGQYLNSDLEEYVIDPDLSDYPTKEEVYTKDQVYTKSETLPASQLYNRAQVYTKSQVDQAVIGLSPDSETLIPIFQSKIDQVEKGEPNGVARTDILTSSFLSGESEVSKLDDGTVVNLLNDITKERQTIKETLYSPRMVAIDDYFIDKVKPVYNKDILGKYYVNTNFYHSIDAREFGVIADYDIVNDTGTDNTAAIQKCVDASLLLGGAKILFPVGRILWDGTVYIHPDVQLNQNFVSICFQGAGKLTIPNNVVIGTCFIRRTVGNMMMVNLKQDGTSYMPTSQQFGSLSVVNCHFQQVGLTSGATVCNMFRTRSLWENVSCSGFDYLLNQPKEDANLALNYCDQSLYYNIRIRDSRYGGIRLQRADSSMLMGFYMESASELNQRCIEVEYTTGFQANGLLFASPNYPGLISDSSFFYCTTSSAIDVKNVHLENLRWESAFRLVQVSASRFGEIHTRFKGRNIFWLSSGCDSVILDNVDIRQDIDNGYFDIKITSATNKNIQYNNFVVKSEASTERSILISSPFTNQLSKSTSLPNVIISGDENIATLNNSNGDLVVFLSTITANRTIDINELSAIHGGESITIINRNTSSFNWSVLSDSGNGIVDINGPEITIIPKYSVLEIQYINTRWRVINIYSQLSVTGVTDFNSIEGTKFIQGLTTSTNGAIPATFGEGFQVLVGNNPLFKRQFVAFGNDWYSGVISNNSRLGWYKFITDSNYTSVFNHKKLSISKSVSYQVLLSDFGTSSELTVYANSSSGVIAITCPSVSEMVGLQLNIVKTDSSINNVIVRAKTGELIINSNEYNLSTEGQSISLQTNGVKLFKI